MGSVTVRPDWCASTAKARRSSIDGADQSAGDLTVARAGLLRAESADELCLSPTGRALLGRGRDSGPTGPIPVPWRFAGADIGRLTGRLFVAAPRDGLGSAIVISWAFSFDSSRDWTALGCASIGPRCTLGNRDTSIPIPICWRCPRNPDGGRRPRPLLFARPLLRERAPLLGFLLVSDVWLLSGWSRDWLLS